MYPWAITIINLGEIQIALHALFETADRAQDEVIEWTRA